MYDKDTFLLQRGYNRQQKRAFSDGWKLRHERKVKQAWTPGGYIDHSRDTSAPFGTLARYGFLLPLEGDFLEAHNKKKKDANSQGGLSDRDRWELEDDYIKAHRKGR